MQENLNKVYDEKVDNLLFSMLMYSIRADLYKSLIKVFLKDLNNVTGMSARSTFLVPCGSFISDFINQIYYYTNCHRFLCYTLFVWYFGHLILTFDFLFLTVSNCSEKNVQSIFLIETSYFCSSVSTLT